MALLAGALMTFGYAPFGFWPMVPLSLVFFLWLLQQPDTQNSFKLSWYFSFGWFAAGISWVHVSIADFGGLPLLASLALMALLCGYLAIYPALALWWLKRSFSPALWPLAIALPWVLAEWLRSWVLTGFPWLSVGYSQIDSPLSGWLPIIGETGVSALLLMLAASIASAIDSKRWQAPTILVIVLLAGGSVADRLNWATPVDSAVDVAMVQGNIKQEIRWTPEQDQPTMQKYRQMTAEHWQNQLVIWPEAAIPKLEPLAVDYLTEMDTLAAANDSALVTGIVNYNFESRDAYNNIVVVGKQHAGDTNGHYRYMHNNRYAKHHLLPIGEFIPFESWLRGLAPLFDLPMSSFSRGNYQQDNLLANGMYLAPALCFEIAFPRQLRANLYPDTDMILTLSNDAWFGDSHGPAQHLEIARVRAKEFALPVLRATNNGITAFVDHRGQIQSRLPQFEAGILTDKIQRVSGNTPYRYFGDLIIWCLAIVALVVAFRLRGSEYKG